VCTGRLVLRSSGLAWRNFIAMSDICRVVEHCLSAPRGRLSDGVYNVGAEQSLRVVDLAELVRVRSAPTLGLMPGIDRPPAAPGEAHEPLHYRIDRLLASGFRLGGSLADELDDTLRFCAAARVASSSHRDHASQP
jgi:UDP-glucose 4-epimerase